MGPVSPSPIMTRTKWRRVIRPAFTSVIIDRSSRSSIGILLQALVTARELLVSDRAAVTGGWLLIVLHARRVKRAVLDQCASRWLARARGISGFARLASGSA